MPIDERVERLYVCDLCDMEFYSYAVRGSRLMAGNVVLEVPGGVFVEDNLVVCTRCAKAVGVAVEKNLVNAVYDMCINDKRWWEKITEPDGINVG